MTFRQWLDQYIEDIRSERDSHPRMCEEWWKEDLVMQTAMEIRDRAELAELERLAEIGREHEHHECIARLSPVEPKENNP